ncbi:peptidoglycan-binding protein [Streptomyces sp. ISL-43]|uniref:peptidoglycan-binding domain-containing protein n=1 Tax=Streptomyces sp. ISL-43 TaxID=2819183 RepID=UPI001BE56D5D|nr:peptidoglycan-binding domain-containing protein [Streptomyces sp. ISL-43]MBT2450212.1 peptidoglycan-binding protein [Streptomyces sp. ISL-43]
MTSAPTRSDDGTVGQDGTSAEMPADGASAGLARQRRWVAVVVGGAVLLAGAGVAASLVIKSPAQTAADAAPPPLDVLVARVEKRVLRDTVIVRGTVSAAQSTQVIPAVAGTEGASAPVVTKVPVRQGDRIDAGKVLLEVSGRPVFALPGSLPVYRDLKPGATGDDVKQLQRALAGLGHPVGGDPAGTFGSGTKTALTAFYTSIGYDAVPAVADRGEAVSSAEEAVTAAERSLEDARGSAARGDTSGTTTGGTEGGSGDGKGGTGTSGGKPGGSGGQDAARAVSRAEEDLRKAQKRRSDAKAAAGPMLPAGEVVFLESFPGRADSVSVHPGSPVNGSAMSLSAGALVVRGQLQEHQRGLVRPGQKVAILSELSGLTAAAEVLSVADTAQAEQPSGQSGTGTTGGQGQQAPAPATATGYALVVRPLQALDAKLVGQDVRLTVEAAATDGDALVVPVSAVSAGADGRTTVTVVDGTGAQRRLEVRPGTTGDGYVEVKPVGDGQLAEGNNVVTGVNPGVAGKNGKGDGGKDGGNKDGGAKSGGAQGGGGKAAGDGAGRGGSKAGVDS